MDADYIHGVFPRIESRDAWSFWLKQTFLVGLLIRSISWYCVGKTTFALKTILQFKHPILLGQDWSLVSQIETWPRKHVSMCLARLSSIANAQEASRVVNGYDKAKLRSIKMADAGHGAFRQSCIVSTRHPVRRRYCGWKDSLDRSIFLS